MFVGESVERLSRISTLWTLLRHAHETAAPRVNPAQALLLDRYRGAVYRYLLGATRDRDAADELFQEFALRLLRGDFRGADSSRGRFRDYLKTSLIHLITDFGRGRRDQMLRLVDDPQSRPTPADDDAFDSAWKAELMNRAWEALKLDNPRLHAILLVHAEMGTMSSAELAAAMTQRFDEPMTGGAARTALHRARRKFAAKLVDEVHRSLGSASADELALELRHLGLLKLCESAIARYDKVVEGEC